jgi:hypothetical protein
MTLLLNEQVKRSEIHGASAREPWLCNISEPEERSGLHRPEPQLAGDIFKGQMDAISNRQLGFVLAGY